MVFRITRGCLDVLHFLSTIFQDMDLDTKLTVTDAKCATQNNEHPGLEPFPPGGNLKQNSHTFGQSLSIFVNPVRTQVDNKWKSMKTWEKPTIQQQVHQF